MTIFLKLHLIYLKCACVKCANVHPSTTEKFSFLRNVMYTQAPEHFCMFSLILRYIPNCKQSTFHFNCAQHHPCGGGLAAKEPIPGQLCAGEGYGGGPHRRQGEPTSSANYESSPGKILSSLQTALSVSLLGSEAGSPPGVILCLSLPARWSSRT